MASRSTPPPGPLYRRLCPSPIGELLLIAHEQALCGCWFADQAGIPAWASQALESPGQRWLRAASTQLRDYFDGQRQDFELPLDLSAGTAFQQSVWQALAPLPYGTLTSYGTLAKRLGRPRAVRALGGAVGRNPIAIVLPCHRVVGADGRLTGYSGGLARKTFLLRLEQPQGLIRP